MSRGERITTLVVGILGLVFMSIQAWDILDKRGAMTASIAIAMWILSIGMVTYAVYRNLRGVQRTQSLLAQIQTIKDEFTLQSKAAEKRHAEALQRVKLSLFEEIQAKYSEPKMPRPENVWAPPGSWKYGGHSIRVVKPHCFNGFQSLLTC